MKNSLYRCVCSIMHRCLGCFYVVLFLGQNAVSIYSSNMARNFDKDKAKALAARYRDVPARIQVLENSCSQYTEHHLSFIASRNITVALTEMEDDEPIEVLNRFCSQKQNVEILRNNGQKTLREISSDLSRLSSSDMKNISNAYWQLQYNVKSSLGWTPNSENSYLLEIADAAVKTDASKNYLEALQRFCKVIPGIEKAISDIDEAVKRRTWLFFPKEKKEAAREAVSFLSKLDETEYLANLSKIESGISKIDKLNTKALFKKNFKTYAPVLEGISPNTFTKPPISKISRPFSIASCMRLYDYHCDLDQRAVDLSSKYPQKRFEEEIKNAAEALVAYLAIETLSTIPVSDLGEKGHRRGMKIIPNYGYKTAGDLISASVYNLSCIPGISYAIAQNIKDAANEAQKAITENTKLKLNTDNKNPYSTAVIVAVYRFLISSEERQSLRAIAQFRKSNVLPELNVLSRGWGDMAWTISDTTERTQIIESWKILVRYSKSSYTTCIANTEAKMEKLYDLDPEEAWAAFEKSPYEFYGVLEDLVPDLIGGQGAYGLPEDLARKIQQECFFPDGLLCELRRYQELGVKYILNRKRVLLGDEMGLGKTVQAIASMVSLRNVGETHFIVVCPAGILSNWCREIMSKSKLSAFKLHGPQLLPGLLAWQKNGGVAVTNYENIKKIKLEDEFHVGMIVVDEAHYIKNKEAQRTKNVLALCTNHTDRILFMTGTPIENKVDEMLALMSFLQPDVASQADGYKTLAQAPMFKELISPVYYRRRRDDVLLEMPDLIKNDRWCSLTPAERMRYESEYGERISTGRGQVNFQALRRVSWNMDRIASQSSKAEMLKEIVEEAKDDGRRVLIFSFFKEVLFKIADMLGSSAMPPITGEMPIDQRQFVIDDFAEQPAGTALIAQITAGGTGLNLQAASVVVICEPQVKPSIENQAISRAYRMGQTRNVLVYRLLAESTVDEHIVEMLEDKQKEFDAFADESVAALESLKLDDGNQKEIIEKEIERIKRERAGNADQDQVENVPEEL